MNVDLDTEAVRGLVDLLGVLGPAPAAPSADTHVLCQCGKRLDLMEIRHQRVWTGVFHALDAMCGECRRMARGMALLACCRCRKIVARVPPCRDPGHELEAGRVYHLDSCPACGAGDMSIVLEHKIRNRR